MIPLLKSRKQESWTDFVIVAVALGIYLITLAPTITWRNEGADSGDLVTAAFTLGIPHPSGYPLYTLLAALFSHLPFGEPARNVSALSALVSAGAILLLVRSGRALLESAVPFARWIPLSVGLAFAFAPAFWSQATIAEVNALSAFFVTALLAVLLSKSAHRLELSALIFGLGLAHHLTIVLLLPTAMLLLSSERYARTRYLRALICALAPLALYLYLPLRAAAHPPVNWGDPETASGFYWVVSGEAYRQYAFATPLAEIPTRIGFIARFLVQNFTVIGVALGVWGAVRMSAHAALRRVFVGLSMAVAITLVFTLGYYSRDSFVYLIPFFIIYAFWVMWGALEILLYLTPLSSAKWVRGLQAAVLIFLVLFPLYNLAENFDTMNVSSDFTAYAYAMNILKRIPSDAVIITEGDEHYFALQYYRYVAAPETKQVIVSSELLQYSWYFDNIRWVMPNVNGSASDPGDRLVEIMDYSLAHGREVFTTVQNDDFVDYALEPRDSYYQVLGRRP